MFVIENKKIFFNIALLVYKKEIYEKVIKKIVRRKHHNFRYLLKQTQNSKDKI